MIKIFNGCCFDEFKNIKDNSINLFILDLPYGITACAWDVKIDLNKMWEEIKRTKTYYAKIIFFCTTRFGVELINSNPSWFRYDLVWEKNKSVGFLNCNNQPLRKHEMIYIFSSNYNNSNQDLNKSRNKELREYSKNIINYINKSNKEIMNIMGDYSLSHFLHYKAVQFYLPTEKNYIKFTNLFNLDKMNNYLNYKELVEKFEKDPKIKGKNIYNPQKTKGKPYFRKRESKINIYNAPLKDNINITGDRHPMSIIKINDEPFKKSNHETEKPVKLLEFLIKSYSNKGDLICDFTMGSGSTGIACLNTNRDFIGIEKDKNIFNTAFKRIEEHKKTINKEL